MSSTLRIVMILALAGAISACTKKVDDEVVYVDEPVSVEPVYTGKYK